MDLDFRPRSSNDKDTAKPQFFIEPVHLAFKSQEAGMPVYEDREFVRIITPGIAKSMPVEEVTQEHKARWPHEYRVFKDGLEEPLTGTPLEKWPPMTPSMCLMLKAQHVRTVEELAGVNDGVLEHLGIGARQFRDRAKDFLALQTEQAPTEAALSRALKAEHDLETLKARFDALEAATASESVKRGPGRPRKAEPSEEPDFD